ncbi:uncharacterized protein LOC123439930 [Hordeum vulgare subsp. vulgare]|uniref:Predicted protein n=1 Tax=Hordeum vulgare subsp. vulgare TaxID=112509 RepID=F2EAC3_HORVV|nr:uncharacterized protein LOC123439930 [Hordeum vulgare subsp. vulgare]BAK04295.1 predicted protein [Hordeum vulgare subsp. vulgare]
MELDGALSAAQKVRDLVKIADCGAAKWSSRWWLPMMHCRRRLSKLQRSVLQWISALSKLQCCAWCFGGALDVAPDLVDGLKVVMQQLGAPMELSSTALGAMLERSSAALRGAMHRPTATPVLQRCALLATTMILLQRRPR